MAIRLLALVISLGIFLSVLDLVRRRKLTFKYALAWLFVSGLAVFMAVFHKILFTMAAWFGFELPSNFIFFTLMCVFVCLSLLLTLFLCQQNERNNCMAQRIAMLEADIEQLKERLSRHGH